MKDIRGTIALTIAALIVLLVPFIEVQYVEEEQAVAPETCDEEEPLSAKDVTKTRKVNILQYLWTRRGSTETLPEPETPSEYVRHEQETELPYLDALGNPIRLVNNPDARPFVGFAELKSFILADDTNEKPYWEQRLCGDFAEELHNNAEQAGIEAAFVVVHFVGDETGHALNAFKSIDRDGVHIVYIDCTGRELRFSNSTTEKGEEDPSLRAPPRAHDTVAYVEEGEKYGLIPVSEARSPHYSFYVEYAENMQKYKSEYQNLLEDYTKEVDLYNEEISGKVYAQGSREYARIELWEATLREKERAMCELRDRLPDWQFESPGIVETVEIYW